MALTALLGGALGLAGSLFGANKAARAQDKATRQQIAVAREFRAEDQANIAPFLQAGTNALSAYEYNLGMGEKPDNYTGYQMSPGAQYMLSEGISGLDASAAARGGLFSGSHAAGLDRHRMGVVQMDRDNHLNRLNSLVGTGQASAAGAAQNNQFYGNQLSGAYANQGNVKAALGIAQGNALTNFANQGMQYYGYAKGLQ